MDTIPEHAMYPEGNKYNPSPASSTSSLSSTSTSSISSVQSNCYDSKIGNKEVGVDNCIEILEEPEPTYALVLDKNNQTVNLAHVTKTDDGYMLEEEGLLIKYPWNINEARFLSDGRSVKRFHGKCISWILRSQDFNL